MIGQKVHNLRSRANRFWNWTLPNRRILPAVLKSGGYTVQTGPFAGMRYIQEVPVEEALIPRLIGCYESELNLPIEQFIAYGYDTVIDVGSSEGYYAVGYARRSPKTRVYAFDIDEEMQRRAKAMIALNGVDDRVEVRGECTPADIQALANGETLIISDCEGGEVELLRPDVAPVLANCDLLVEVHDCFVEGVSSTMRDRFGSTHDIFVVQSMMPDVRRHVCIQGLSERYRRVALDERRPVPMEWFIMWRRAAGTGRGAATGRRARGDERAGRAGPSARSGG